MFQFSQACRIARAATLAALTARARLPRREQFRKSWDPETQEERAAYFAACRAVNRAKGEAYAARLAAAVAAVGEGVPLAYSEGQEGGVFHLPYPSTVSVWGLSPNYNPNQEFHVLLDNGVSARGLYRQVKGYYPTWQELEGFVEELCAPRTPHREGRRALRSDPIRRDLADG
jgi:hypothetical protein